MSEAKFETVAVLKSDDLRPKITELARLISEEKGVRVHGYAAVRIAIENELAARNQAGATAHETHTV